MDHFLYRDGRPFTPRMSPWPRSRPRSVRPCYIYSTATLERHFRLFDEALAGMDHLVCYAMKAASNQAILKVMADLGAGMDVVSGGEYARAKAAGVPGDKIVFSGVGKTRDEMRRGAGRRGAPVQPRIRAGDGSVERGCPVPGRRGPCHRAGEPRRGRQDPRQDRHRQVGEQVRHPDHPCARSLCPHWPICRACAPWASTCILAAS